MSNIRSGTPHPVILSGAPHPVILSGALAESKDLAIKDEETKETHNLERSHGETG